MLYDPTTIGLSEARLQAILAILEAGRANLNTHLNTDSQTSDFANVQNSDFGIGDLRAAWQYTEDAIKIRVSAGDYQSGVDTESKRIDMPQTSTTYGLQHTFTTSVYIYIHANAIQDKDVNREAQTREILQGRLADWLLWTLNAAWSIDLTSHRMTVAPDTDNLSLGMVTQLSKGIYGRGPQQEIQLYGLHANFEAMVY